MIFNRFAETNKQVATTSFPSSGKGFTQVSISAATPTTVAPVPTAGVQGRATKGMNGMQFSMPAPPALSLHGEATGGASAPPSAFRPPSASLAVSGSSSAGFASYSSGIIAVV